MLIVVAVLAFLLGGYVAKGLASMDAAKVIQNESN